MTQKKEFSDELLDKSVQISLKDGTEITGVVEKVETTKIFVRQDENNRKKRFTINQVKEVKIVEDN